MKRFQKLRRHIADFILGDDTVLFTNGRDHELIKNIRYLDASDEAIGRMFKHFWTYVARHFADEAEEKDMDFRGKMISGCVLYLASEANKANASSADFIVSGSLDGGKTKSKWAVRIEECPDEEMNRNEEPVIVRDPSDEDKIVSLTVSFGNPGYEEWARKNQERMQKVLSPEEGSS